MSRDFAEIARGLRENESLEDVAVLERGTRRVVARAGDTIVKVFLRPDRRVRQEARSLERARGLGLPVPELLGRGRDWIAMRYVEGRPGERNDLPLLLAAAEQMHGRGMLHRDLHRGNLRVDGRDVTLIDVQKARFLPLVPGILRRWELGYLAYSLGEPLPPELVSARRWCAWRAHTHWRSRTRRCLTDSGGFAPFRWGGERGFRRRELDGSRARDLLGGLRRAKLLKDEPAGTLYRLDGCVLKRFPTRRGARAAWVGGRGLEVRGIPAARTLAWAGRWLVMEDAGPTLIDWVAGCFASAAPETRESMADALAGLLADLHRRGVHHRDLKANNVCWSPGSEPRLLDYGRVRFRVRVTRGRRIKNLAQLNAALPDGVGSDLRERALQGYLAASGYRDDPDALRHAVVRLSLRRRHLWSGCGPEEVRA